MVGEKKRKRGERTSVSPPRKAGETPSEGLNNLFTTMTTDFQALQSKLQRFIAEQKATNSDLYEKYTSTLKELRPLKKQFVKERGLNLVNEFIGFVSQVHKTGFQRKYTKSYNTGKFNKLITNSDFITDCQEFMSYETDASPKSTCDISNIFNIVCDSRHRLVHFEEAKDCVRKILKFKKKYEEFLIKCSEEVQFCLSKIQNLARYLLGPYRLKRLACQFIAWYLASKGCSWTNSKQLQSILNRKYKLIKKFKPAEMAPQQFKSHIVTLFESSKLHGPTWTGFLNDKSTDFQAILTAFTSCKAVSMLPPVDSHTVEYSILHNTVV